MFHMTMFPKPLKNCNDGFSVQTEFCNQIPPDLKKPKDSSFDSPERQDKESHATTKKTKNLSEELLKRILSNHVLDSELQAKLTNILLNKKGNSKDTNKKTLNTVLASVEPKPGIFNIRESTSFHERENYVNKTNQPLYDEAVVNPLNMLVETRKQRTDLIFSNKSEDPKHCTINTERRINDKSTYCRPYLSSNNPEYVMCKTEDRNKQLQKIVRRVLQNREKENEKELWKNYINSLRLKHGYSAITDIDNTQIEENDNFFEESRLEMHKALPYKDLLKDLYEAAQVYEYSSEDDMEKVSVDYDKLCYPSSSHVLEMTNLKNKNGGLSMVIFPKCKCKSISIQTEAETKSAEVSAIEETCINKLIKWSSSYISKKLSVLDSNNKINQTTLRTIERKVDNLVKTINKFLDEVKSDRSYDRNKIIDCKIVNRDKQDSCICKKTSDVKIHKQIPGKIIYGNTTTPSYYAVETNFFSNKQQQKKIYQPDHKNMTIAVNTDPLGLLALLAVSTEALKKIFSYVPNFSVATQYWSLEPKLRAGSEGIMSYICNICGANFSKPSQLSNHIAIHNLANSRNCCICRQLMERGLHQFKRFRCQYCDEGFTRAYCCYLHEDSCARSLGKRPDTPSDLKILR